MLSTQKLENLIHQSTINGHDISFIGQFEALKEDNINNQWLKCQCDNWVAFIYSLNDCPEKAVNIYIEILSHGKEHLTGQQVVTIVQAIIYLLTSLDRKQEALEIFKKHIHTEAFHSSFDSLPLLAWYASEFHPNEEHLVSFSPMIKAVIKDLGYQPKKEKLKDQIIEIKEVNTVFNKQLSYALLSFPEKSQTEKIKAMEDYLSSNPPTYYKMKAKNTIKKLKSSTRWE